MRTYRFYYISDGSGAISFENQYECEDDTAAESLALKLLASGNQLGIEVWCLHRMVYRKLKAENK